MLYRLREFNEGIRLKGRVQGYCSGCVHVWYSFRSFNGRQFGALAGVANSVVFKLESDLTSAVAESIVQDKELTKTLLHAAGIPVPWAGR